MTEAETVTVDVMLSEVTQVNAPRRTVIGATGGKLTPFDSASASAAARRRWEKVSAATRRGMANAGKQLADISRAGSVAVAEYLAEQHTLNAADPSARGSVLSYKQVMHYAFPEPARAAAEPAPGGAAFYLSAGAVDRIASLLIAAQQGQQQGPGTEKNSENNT